jgi:putative membrane protein
MLLVHPVRTLWSMAVPLLIAVFVGRGEDGGWLWIAVAGGALALVAGVMTWFITRYRFTPDQLQLRTGLLSRRVLTAPLDRIRSVDIESSPVHRVLGLAKVKVGTGVDSKQIELDGLTHEQAAHLRVDLLRRSGAADDAVEGAAGGEAVLAHGASAAHPGASDAAHPAGPGGGPGAEPGAPMRSGGPDRELARIDWGWLRYAPFSLSSLVVVAGAVGVLSQFGDELPVDEVAVAQDAWAWVVAQALLVLAAGIALLVLLGWVLVSTASYVLTWWNLRLVREGTGNIRITHGLLTTRSQTIERAKVRGVRMGEPFLLRFVRGAELSAMATGVGMSGTVKVLPPAPRSVVQEVGHELLEEDGPLTMDLRGHGPKARRRTHVSRQWGTLLLTALMGVPTYLVDVWWFAAWPWWLPLLVLGVVGTLNALVAESAWRNLGHALTAQHLVVQTGAVVRTREVLERAGIIGWVVHQGFFQRRLGLADLTATTAAGPEQVVAPNIPLPMAVELARAATPGMLDELAV